MSQRRIRRSRFDDFTAERKDARKLLRGMRSIASCAPFIRDQAQLDRLLEGADPLSRRAMLEALAPQLSFVPEGLANANEEEGERTFHQAQPQG